MRRFTLRRRLLSEISGFVVNNHGVIGGLTLQSLAAASGLSLWKLRYHFDNADQLYREVVVYLLDEVEARLVAPRPDGAGVLEAIQAEARFLAELMGTSEYGGLLSLMVSSRGRDERLVGAYERRVVDAAVKTLEDRVASAAREGGTAVMLRQGAALDFFRRIETEVALPLLLPPFAPRSAQEIDGILKPIVRRAFEATYAFDWQEASAA